MSTLVFQRVRMAIGLLIEDMILSMPDFCRSQLCLVMLSEAMCNERPSLKVLILLGP